MRIAITILMTVWFSSVSYAGDLSAGNVGEIMGVKATTTPDGVVRVAWPRKDV
jgi:hypothetical protein